MSRTGGDFDDIDWLDDEPEATVGTTTPRLPWPRWFTLAVAVLVIAAVVAVLNTMRRTPQRAPVAAATTPAPSSRPAPGTSSSGASAPKASPSTSPVSVVRLGHPLLGVTAGWEVIARGVDVLARIQPAAGLITVTTVPDLRSTGPVSLVAGPDRVLIRPWDSVAGYLVRDGKPATELPPSPNAGGPVFPGPKPGQMWVPADDNQSVMTLATLDGRRLTGSVRVPPGSSPFDGTADGAGYLLYPGIGGVYAARPDGLRRISTGVLAAVGTPGWLVVECDDRYRCQTVLIDRQDGSRRVMPADIGSEDRGGAISPDGATAAMIYPSPSGAPELYLLDLATGRRRVVHLPVTQEAQNGAIAFSPDGTWLFVVTTGGGLAAVDRRTGAISALNLRLPGLTQLAVRPAPGS